MYIYGYFVDRFITYSSLGLDENVNDSVRLYPWNMKSKRFSGYSTREASRSLYFHYYVNKLNRRCLHAVFCQRNQRNPHRFAKSANRK